MHQRNNTAFAILIWKLDRLLTNFETVRLAAMTYYHYFTNLLLVTATKPNCNAIPEIICFYVSALEISNSNRVY